jgi:uncharacterized repeat protein (TIGR01451 family)
MANSHPRHPAFLSHMARRPHAQDLRILFTLIAALVLMVPFIPSHAAPSWQAKVDPWVIETASQSAQTEFLVSFQDKADLSQASALASKADRGAYVVAQLQATATHSQGPLIAELERLGLSYRPYWLVNAIWVRGDLAAVQALARRPDVAHLYANPQVKLDSPDPAQLSQLNLQPSIFNLQSSSSSLQTSTIEWNLSQINAPQAWAGGYTGQGAVVAGADTGYDWKHPALKRHYRGWDGAAADHNYNWHDAIHPSGDISSSYCGYDSPEPCDDYGHGTHTMGTMVGDDGLGNQVGVAPGARWIGCRNMNNGVGTPASYIECYEFFAAPTDLSGQNPRPELAPDVINNSWYCPTSEGCTDPTILLEAVQNVRTAGILTVHSTGNSGPGCSTVSSPAAIYQESFSVGATDSNDLIAYFSSRGPVVADGSNRLKPDVSAPGVGIRSSVPGGGYESGWQGTSMAAPHVAGLAALLISAHPALNGDVDLLETTIEQSAVPRTTDESCGETSGSAIPNNTYGWGRIDACRALQSAAPRLAIQKAAAQSSFEAGGSLTYRLTITSFYPTLVHQVAIIETLPAGTSFVSASLPPLVSGDTLRWDIPELSPCASQQIEFTVKIADQPPGSIDNLTYSASSAELPIPVFGQPLSTPLRRLYFPLFNFSLP